MAWSADLHKPNHIEHEVDLHLETVVARRGGGRKDEALAGFAHIFQVSRTVRDVLEQIEPEVERVRTAGHRDVELHGQTSDIVVVFRDGVVETWTRFCGFSSLLSENFVEHSVERSVEAFECSPI